MKDAHCSYCGALHVALNYPKQCVICRQVAWRNPLPIVVGLVPVNDGLLVVRRADEPRKGWLNLPGGHLEFAEEWNVGLSRELGEEAGLEIKPEAFKLYDVRATPTGYLIVFGLAPRLVGVNISALKHDKEVSEISIITEPVELGFPTHTEMAARHFAGLAAASQPAQARP